MPVSDRDIAHVARFCRKPMAALLSIGLLTGCADATPLYGPSSPRDGAGHPVDPVSGIPLPGVALYGT